MTTEPLYLIVGALFLVVFSQDKCWLVQRPCDWKITDELA